MYDSSVTCLRKWELARTHIVDCTQERILKHFPPSNWGIAIIDLLVLATLLPLSKKR